jgi:hypothetical protein
VTEADQSNIQDDPEYNAILLAVGEYLAAWSNVAPWGNQAAPAPAPMVSPELMLLIPPDGLHADRPKHEASTPSDFFMIRRIW